MHALRPVFLATLMGGVVLSACSKPAAEALATEPPAAAASGASAQSGDPCSLVTDGEVRKSFAGAKSGERDHSLDQYGIASCKWEATASTLIVQIYGVKGTLENELRGRMLGSLDPLQPAARDKVRYDVIAALSDEAMVVVEKGDPPAGVLADVAVLGMRHEEKFAIIFNSTLVEGDRAATIKALETLARSAAPRL